MSLSDDDPKKRPPPIRVPPAIPLYPHLPKRSDSASNGRHAQQQHSDGFASAAQTGTDSAPLTSPLQNENPPMPHVVPRDQSRASALNALNTIMDQTRPSPQKTNPVSATGSHPNSSSRSRHSLRSQHNTAAAQAPLLMFTGDEQTSRGKMEARNEQQSGKAGTGEVVIERHDLRDQCKIANPEKREETGKSPKKKFLGMTFPFGRSQAPMAKPLMTSKAAQVLGEAPRIVRRIEAEPILPPDFDCTPTKAPRSNTAKSLPDKIMNQDDYARNHHRNAARRHRTATRRSPTRTDRQQIDMMHPVPALNASYTSASPQPPTPPAKDTPPDGKAILRPASPLRRAAASDRLHQTFKAQPGLEVKMQYPAFALSPWLSTTGSVKDPEKKQANFQPYTAGEYQNMIVGTPFPFASEQDTGISETGAAHNPSPASEKALAPSLYDTDKHSDGRYSHCFGREDEQSSADRWSGQQYSGKTQDFGMLQPVAYSQQRGSVGPFPGSETPSKISSRSRSLRTSAPIQKPSRVSSKTSNSPRNFGIDLMAHAETQNTNAGSASIQAPNDHNSAGAPEANAHNGKALFSMQELRIGEHNNSSLPASGTKTHLLPEQSSSRLSEMLVDMSPQRHGFEANFQPNCPSAVPSPLHHVPGPCTPMQSMPPIQPIPVPGSAIGPWVPTPTRKTMDYHFLMVAEHLDVVGKTTWDAIDAVRKDMAPLISDKNKQLSAKVESHINDVKMQIDFVNEKTDRNTEQSHNIHTKLEELCNFVQDEVMGSLSSQGKRMEAIEQSMQDLQKAIQNIHKTLEQKLSDPDGGQQHPAAAPFPIASSASSPFPPPNHRSQPSLAGFYGNMAEAGREGQSPMANMHDPRTNGPAHDVNDARGGFGNGFGQQWGTRPGYGRGSKEDRQYLSNSPYQFANPGPYGNNYTGGYSGFDMQPSTPSQHYGGHQGPSK